MSEHKNPKIIYRRTIPRSTVNKKITIVHKYIPGTKKAQITNNYTPQNTNTPPLGNLAPQINNPIHTYQFSAKKLLINTTYVAVTAGLISTLGYLFYLNDKWNDEEKQQSNQIKSPHSINNIIEQEERYILKDPNSYVKKDFFQKQLKENNYELK